MAKCHHDVIRVDVRIERWTGVVVDLQDAMLVEDEPHSMRLNVECRNCNYVSAFTVYPYRADGFGWSRWPKWLLRRMQVIRQVAPAVDEALRQFEYDAVSPETPKASANI